MVMYKRLCCSTTNGINSYHVCIKVFCVTHMDVLGKSPHHLSVFHIQLGLHNTRLHRINGIIVLLSFFTCRILLFPFMYWMYGRQFGIPLHRVVFHLPLQCNVGNLVLLAPQIYWFILLLRKANRLYLRQRKGPARKDWRLHDFQKKKTTQNPQITVNEKISLLFS